MAQDRDGKRGKISRYTTILGDEWDAIAHKAYSGRMRGEMLMHLLLEANPAHRDTVAFGSGVELDIPDVPESATSLPAPWMTP